MQTGTYEDGNGGGTVTVLEANSPPRERLLEDAASPQAANENGEDARYKPAIVGLRLAMLLALLLWALVATALWSMLR
jgi:hypothetical protein